MAASPDMDGLAHASDGRRRSIAADRQSEGGSQVKIVAVTASGYVGGRNSVMAAGLDDYIHKPYRPAEIFECMARQLGVRYNISEVAIRQDPEYAGDLATRLSDLPDELRGELRDTLFTLDPDRISAIIQRISRENAPLGSVLARCADQYAYSKILQAIARQDVNTPVVSTEVVNETSG